MDLKIIDMAPPNPTRSGWGRVVITPPGVMGKIKPEEKGSFFWCCNRAFLSEETYKEHVETKEEHKKELDFSTLPRTDPYERVGKALTDQNSTEFWMCRKQGLPLPQRDDEVDVKMETETEGQSNSPPTSGRHIENFYVCPICNIKVHVCNKRRHNERNHVEGGKYPCSHCPCVFALEATLRHHQSRFHQNKCTPVAIKNALVSKAKKKLEEVVHRKGKAIYKCQTCGVVFDKSLKLRDHMNTHTGARPYKCESCGYQFAHFSNLRRHKKVAHTHGDQFFCQICSCSFSSHHLLARHTTTVHRTQDSQPEEPQTIEVVPELESPKLVPIYPVPNSSAPGPSRSRCASPAESVALPNLTLQHPGPNANSLYECHVCHKELSTPQTWRGHMLIHQNLKPYECKHCGISFRLHSTRKSHIVSCHSKGAFPCKFCTCRFLTRKGLVHHLQLYHGGSRKPLGSRPQNGPGHEERVEPEEPQVESPPVPVMNHDANTSGIATSFKCQLCGKYMRSMDDFQKHKIVHKIRVRGQCNMCLKTFNHANNVGPHKKSSHEGGSHKCSFCCCRYSQTKSLFKHLVQAHGMHRDEWNFSTKRIKPAAINRIQMQSYQRDVGDTHLPTPSEEDMRAIRSVSPLPRAMHYRSTLGSSRKTVECKKCHLIIQRRNVSFHMKRSHDHGGQFQCDKCSCHFMKEQGLSRHKNLYHGDKPQYRLPEQPRFNHRVHVHLPRPKTFSSRGGSGVRHVCKICHRSFASLRHLNFHLREHKYGKTFSCKLCPMTFGLPTSLVNHEKSSHAVNGKFQCSQCACKFKSSQGLAGHSKLHAVPKSSASTFNGHTFYSEAEPPDVPELRSVQEPVASSSRTHMEVHTRVPKKEMKYECNICHQKFSNSDSISTHKKLNHFHDGKFKCSKCPCKFKTELGRKYHTTKHHVKKKPMPTPVARPVHQEPQNLPSSSEQVPATEQHNLPERSPRVQPQPSTLNQCPYCLKVMCSEDSLRTHLQIHTRGKGEKKFECNICHLRFLHSESVGHHKKNCHFHNGTFQCSHCTCKFQSAWGLVVHQNRYHKTGARGNGRDRDKLRRLKKFKCTLCDKILTQKYYKDHMRWHARRGDCENENIECDMCDMKFSTADDLATHISEYHPNHPRNQGGRAEQFQCNLCACNFETSNGLEWHLKRSHGVSNESVRRSQDFQRMQEQLSEDSSEEAEAGPSMPPPPAPPPRQVICDLCNLPLGPTTKLHDHKKTSHVENGQFKCSRCTCVFATFRGRVRHMLHYHPEEGESLSEPVPVPVFVEPASDYRPRKIILPSAPSSIASTFGMARKALKTSIQRSMKKHRCALCGNTFDRQFFLKQHTQKAHTNGMYQCSSCPCSFHTKNGLLGHTNSRHRKRKSETQNASDDVRPSTSTGGGSSSYLPTNTIHRKRKSETQNASGDVRPSTGGGSSSYLPTGYLSSLPQTEDQPSCRLCGIPFKKNNMPQHMRVAHSGGTFRCTQCSCCFHSSFGLLKHLAWKHNTSSPYVQQPVPVADVNNAASESSSDNDDQGQDADEGGNASEAPRSRNAITCEICGVVVHRRDYLVKHQQVAHTNGKYKCQKCVCCYHTPVGLGKHKAWHQKQETSVRSGMNGIGTSRSTNSIIESPSRVRFSVSPSRPSSSSSPKNLKFKCNMCPLKFKNASYLIRHRQRAHTSGLYQCNSCPCSFFTSNGLSAHARIHHLAFRGASTTVSRSNESPEEEEITLHHSRAVAVDTPAPSQQRTQSPQRPLKSKHEFRCDSCGLRFAETRQLMRHKEIAHTGGVHKCTMCTCGFATLSLLSAHKRMHHRRNAGGRVRVQTNARENDDSSPQNPGPSGQISPRRDGLPVRPSKTEPYKFRCDLCGLRFVRKKYFTKHLRQAHVDGGLKCDVCSCSFASTWERGAHRRTYHIKSTSGARHMTIARNAIQKLKSRFRHVTDQTRSQVPVASLKRLTFSCNRCGLKFSHRGSLQRHVQNAHSGGSHECNLCTCAFNSLTSLAAHKRYRHNVLEGGSADSEPSTSSQSQQRLRPRSSTAGSSSSTRRAGSDLNDDGNLGYQCSICLKMWNDQYQLRRHILTHTRPEQCVKCNGRFRTKLELEKHLKNSHGNGAFQCPICSCRFASQVGMKTHVTYVHKNQNSSAWSSNVNAGNYVIEHEQENYYDDETYLRIGATYSQHQELQENGSQESEPVLEEQNWDSGMNGEDHRNNQFHHLGNDEDGNESVPILQSIVHHGSPQDDASNELRTPRSPFVHRVARKHTYTPKTRPIACETCGEVCLGQEKLSLHMESHHADDEAMDEGNDAEQADSNNQEESSDDEMAEQINCEKCTATFGSNDKLSRHLEREHDESGHYRCFYCPCAMTTEENLRYHFAKYHSEK